jgi:hypothetical protein
MEKNTLHPDIDSSRGIWPPMTNDHPALGFCPGQPRQVHPEVVGDRREWKDRVDV